MTRARSLLTQASSTRGRQPSFSVSTRQLGLYVLLASLSVVFGAGIVGYLVTRANSPSWRPLGVPGLPFGLWVSSALAIAISVSLEAARRAAATNRVDALYGHLRLGGFFAFGFLALQLLNWKVLQAALIRANLHTLFADTFYLLTGLHAVHVIGGLVPLGIVLARARRHEYSSSRYEGLSLCVQYWHFLTAVWAILFVLLELGSLR